MLLNKFQGKNVWTFLVYDLFYPFTDSLHIFMIEQSSTSTQSSEGSHRISISEVGTVVSNVFRTGRSTRRNAQNNHLIENSK